jgi:hypothetical protein
MTQTMRALVKPTAAPGLEIREVPVPTAGAGEVLIKLEKTAICGTDLHIYKWDEWSQRTIKPPLVIGHEFVGRIVEMGDGVHRLHGRPARQRRGPRRLRPLPQLPCRPPAPVPAHGASASTATARSPNTSLSRPPTCGRSPTRSPPSWRLFSTRSATPRTARWSSTWLAKTC